MDIVCPKIMVGLLGEKEEVMEHLEKYFEWKFRGNIKIKKIFTWGVAI
jgi:hypothetical protein